MKLTGDKMNAAEIAALATAVATCITAVGGVIIAIRTSGVRKTVNETHELVNQRYTDLVAYQEKLVKTLQEAGVIIPVDRSLKRTQQ
jgi:hypothetical protein